LPSRAASRMFSIILACSKALSGMSSNIRPA
jgi:hypothetical protein